MGVADLKKYITQSNKSDPTFQGLLAEGAGAHGKKNGNIRWRWTEQGTVNGKALL